MGEPSGAEMDVVMIGVDVYSCRSSALSKEPVQERRWWSRECLPMIRGIAYTGLPAPDGSQISGPSARAVGASNARFGELDLAEHELGLAPLEELLGHRDGKSGENAGSNASQLRAPLFPRQKTPRNRANRVETYRDQGRLGLGIIAKLLKLPCVSSSREQRLPKYLTGRYNY